MSAIQNTQDCSFPDITECELVSSPCTALTAVTPKLIITDLLLAVGDEINDKFLISYPINSLAYKVVIVASYKFAVVLLIVYTSDPVYWNVVHFFCIVPSVIPQVVVDQNGINSCRNDFIINLGHLPHLCHYKLQ